MRMEYLSVGIKDLHVVHGSVNQEIQARVVHIPSITSSDPHGKSVLPTPTTSIGSAVLEVLVPKERMVPPEKTGRVLLNCKLELLHGHFRFPVAKGSAGRR